MNVKQLKLRRLNIPLRFQFSQSNNAGTRQSLAALLELETADGVKGYGESCPRTYVTGETMESVRTDLQKIAPRLYERPVSSPEELKARLYQWEKKGIGNSSLCAVELAWLDAWSRTENKPLTELLGVSGDKTLSYSLILPLLSPQKMAGLFQNLSAFRPPKIKFKVDKDLDSAIAKVKLIQEYFGFDTPIRVDVNGGWTLAEALENIPALMKQGVYSFEEPLPAGQMMELSELTRRFGSEARIMVDESLLSLYKAQFLLEHGLCNHFNLKISKLGGIFRTQDVYRLAAEYGVSCQLGAHFGETSLLTAAGLLLAATAGPLTACEGAMGEFLLERDIGQPSIRHALNGALSMEDYLAKPGLTEMVDGDLVEKYTGFSTVF